MRASAPSARCSSATTSIWAGRAGRGHGARFLSQVAEAWELGDPLAELALKWAARLHEIGLDVAHSGYHRHGAYLLENADMPGFAREEQQLLARLVGTHRRKLALEGLEELIPPWDRSAVHLIVLLRLAVLLHRGRSAAALPNIELAARRARWRCASRRAGSRSIR